MLTLNLPPDLERMLGDLSQTTGLSREALVEEAIRDRMEDLEDIRIAEERLADLEAGRSERIPLAEVVKRLGLDH